MISNLTTLLNKGEQRLFRKSISKSCSTSGFYKIYKRMNKYKTIVLAYHGFLSERFKKDYNEIDNDDGLHIYIDSFISHIKFLKNNYNIISVSNLYGYINSGKQLPEYSISITIDDGFENNYTVLWPVIREHNIPVTIFLTAGLIGSDFTIWPLRLKNYLINKKKGGNVLKKYEILLDMFIKNNPGYNFYLNCYKNKVDFENLFKKQYYRILNWEQVIKMSQDKNIEFGSHGLNHAILSNCNQKELNLEISESKKILEKKLKKPIHYFSYPNGSQSDFNESAITILRNTGFKLAFSCVNGAVASGDDIFQLRRMSMNNRFCQV
tara:strand:+ start:1560 stop:2528 length:969 start_codon:yes stop_codon:yes gene_type:complete